MIILNYEEKIVNDSLNCETLIFFWISVMALFKKKLGSKFLGIRHLCRVQLSVTQVLNPVLLVTLKSLNELAFGNSLSVVIISRSACITACTILDLV
jgi:hypothetical protein